MATPLLAHKRGSMTEVGNSVVANHSVFGELTIPETDVLNELEKHDLHGAHL